MFSLLRRHLYTLFLFTYSDMKTILLPITVFASVAAPAQSPQCLLLGVFWTWLHQLHANLSNQYRALEEDKMNKPWRPLPAHRVTPRQAELLRWTLIPLTIGFSTLGGPHAVAASIWLATALVIYEQPSVSGHWLGKNILNTAGYIGFEYGATAMLGEGRPLSASAVLLLLCSGLVILTTIHAQDFADIAGDSALGRVTFPIRAPALSRALIYLGIPLLSLALSIAWDMFWAARVLFLALGSAVAWRFYAFRTISHDARSYVLYNVWLFSVHLLPATQRHWL
ncbi:hypothetical protein K525DRAFT_255409 [Schizophyllum commune Loenen D]|nr:hypothetical protein K525DRAFT_255409 [Schizophyllum commune Loenen D]